MKKKAKIIAIANQKGGVGKTTITSNLSAACALIRNKKVLVIDCDHQHHTSNLLFYRQKPERALSHNPTMSDFFMQNTSIIHNRLITDSNFEEETSNKLNLPKLSEGICPTLINNLYIIPSSPALAFAENSMLTMNMLVKEKRLYSLLYNTNDTILEDFDYIFIDNSPSLGTLLINSLVATDYVLIPVECEELAMNGLNLLFQTIIPIKKELNQKIEILGILINNYYKGWNVYKRYKEILEKNYSKYLLKSYIRQNTKIKEAQSKKMTILEYAPSCRGSNDIIDVMNELLEKLGDITVDDYKPSNIKQESEALGV